MNNSSIQITKETKDKLDYVLGKRATYEEIIKHLLDFYNQHQNK